MNPIVIRRNANSHEMILQSERVGKDILVRIYGGDESHIGGVALAYPTKSHYRNATTISVNTITSPGHKDYVLANSAAEKLSEALEVTVVVAVGIHVEDASWELIEEIISVVESMVDELIEKYQESE